MLGHTGRRLEGAQRREAAAEPGLAGREPAPVREARLVSQEGGYALRGLEILVGGDRPDGASVGDGLVDGEIECPWHYSRYRMTNGHVTLGPSVYDQPAYEVRAAEGGGWEARRQPG